MLDRVEEIAIPDEWRNVDLVKQTKEVMVRLKILCTEITLSF